MGFAVKDGVNILFRTATTPPRRDPLAIDLDGDGIETVGIPATGSPILFDHDGDGVKTGTGWVKGDDAWLVLDRNGNGTIDSGAELFGVDTLITEVVQKRLQVVPPMAHGQETVTRNARSGFEALASLDTGNGTAGSVGYGDGVFDANDAAFTQVKLWQDLNQDGVSQSSELFTLSDKGIVSIGLAASTTTTNLGNGNTVTGQATVTRTGGETTVIDSVDLQASNLTLADNPFYREFTDTIPLTAEAQALPEMGGSGWLRDLREAMSLGTAQAQTLTLAVSTLAAGASRDQQLAGLDAVIDDWAQTTGRVDTSAYRPVKSTVLSDDGTTRTIRVTTYDPADYPDPSSSLVPCAAFTLPDSYYTHVLDSNNMEVPVLTAEGEEVFRRLGDLEAFNGARFLNLTVTQSLSSAGGGQGSGGGGGGSSGEVPTKGYQTQYLVNLAPEQVAALNAAYDALRDSVYTGIVVQTRLRPYLNAVDLVIGEDGLHFDTTALAAKLDTYKSSDQRNALIDLVELNQYAQSTLQAVGFDGVHILHDWVDALPTGDPLRAELIGLDVLGAESITGSARSDIFLGDAESNYFYGGAGNDALDGGDGNDTLNGDEGNDVLLGGAGIDLLTGGVGADTLTGGDGDDYLGGDGMYGGNGGNDVLDGGAGNDQLVGGFGSDTYLFGRGDGQDAISNYADAWGGSVDPTTGKQDVLQFKAGVLASDVTVTREGDSLTLKINGTTDQVSISNYFNSDGLSDQGWAVEQIRFNDGTSWDVATVKSKVLNGATADNDTITGYATNDTINGLAGDDMLYGHDGNDTLDGGEGNDQLDGENGDDVLKGGAGNDVLIGSAGADTLTGGDGDDYLAGDGMYGGAGGADVLDGGAGNDQLVGGFGSDAYLFGRGDGQDTIMNNADGWNGYADPTVGKQDVLQFKAGVLASDVVLTREGDNLVAKINGTTDQVTVSNYFNGDGVSDQGWAVEQIRFDDGTSWNVATVKSKVLNGATSGNDTITGYATNDTINGLAGDDLLYGHDGNDTLDGGDGNDQLDGENGNDILMGGVGNDTLIGSAGADALTGGDGDDYLAGDGMYGGAGGDDVLDGGAGNDQLVGGYGSDTYLFGRGDGQDTVNNYADAWNGYADPTVGKQDVLQFKAGVLASDVVLTREGDNLVAKINGTTDQVTVSNYFNGDGVSDQGWAVEQIRFDDGTSWDVATVKSKVLNGATAGNDTITGYATNDTINGLAGDDMLYGHDGNDTLDGGDGNDQLDGENGNDILMGGAGNDTLIGSAGADTLTGSVGDDYLAGDGIYGGVGGDDVLDGGAGNDQLVGGFGSDSYLFGRGDGQDTISNYADAWGGSVDPTAGKQDVLQFKAGVLASDVALARDGDNLILKINGTTDQVTISNYFNGDGVSDQGWAVEQIRFNDGTSWNVATVKTMVLQGTAGNDTLTGYASNDSLAGFAGDDTLYGLAGTDILDGGVGADTMVGGTGDDIYVVDNVADVTSEDASAGNDTVRATLSWTLAANVENLTLLGTSAINGTGSSVHNVLTGNAAANILNGGAGADAMAGGAGNDTYVVDNTGDVITENASEGTDLVQSSVTYTLAANVENLTLTGSGAVNGTGNTLANILTGNGGANRLDGGAGVDSMTGGAGNDTYVVDNVGDTTVEAASGGTDTVQSTVAWTLGSNLENLTLLGSTAINGTGNTLDNTLTGNSGANTLTGNAGNDALDGGAGADTLIGGAGNDKYVMGRGYGAELVQENDATAGNADVIQFLSGVATDQVWFRQVGNDLEVSIIGTTDKSTVQNWYLGSQYHVEQFKTSDGKTLLDSKVQDLVSAMASFTPPAVGQTTLPSNYQTTLLPAIAADWGP